MLQQKPKIVPYEHYKDLIGKPFEDMGRGPDGYDCWGPILELYKKIGIELADYIDVSCHCKDGNGIIERYKKYSYLFKKLEKDEKPEGYDLIVYKQLSGSLHFGIVLNDCEFLHVTEKGGVQKPCYDHPIIKQLIEYFYRYKEL